jgi:starch synthase
MEKNKIKNICMLTREYGSIAGAGGVKDVVPELSESFIHLGFKVDVIMPCYGFIDPVEKGFSSREGEFEVDMNYKDRERREKITFYEKNENSINIILVSSKRFSEKNGVYSYTAIDEEKNPSHPKGGGHYDYFPMNVLLQKAALIYYLSQHKKPDIFHCHDGHTALLPAIMRELEGFRVYFRDSCSLITIHNAGKGYHQEIMDISFAKANTGLPKRLIDKSILAKAFDPFIAGAYYCPINTVSENYARELRETPLDELTGWLGHTLKAKGITIDGITNGINPNNFNPKNPEKLGLDVAFDPLNGDFNGKYHARNKIYNILRENSALKIFGNLYESQSPILTVISRLTKQKGIEVLVDALTSLFRTDFQIIILGEGTKDIEEHIKNLVQNPSLNGRAAFIADYNPELSNLIYATGDFFIIPSLYEPCGLTDFKAQLVGNLPIVRETGGLVKVIDGFNGFSYKNQNAQELREVIARAIETYKNSPDTIHRMRVDAVKNIYENYTWEKVAIKYLALYEKAMEF